ncbi:MAG: RNA polymerase sigma factor [Actinobacteria bacterium]|nr:RNA polymerase sigma factor [Actinomycetota bacterium]
MEASVLREPGVNSPTLLKDPRAGFLRLQSDERLVSLTRRGNDAAFETLIARYRTRLLAFSRHMVGSAEDAEDILQEVFVAAYRAMLADERELNVRPWLYRIARNRSLNHLRRPRPSGVDSMDVFEGGAAVATADRVHDKLDLEDLVGDVKKLPETQRTALMLREMGDLSYDQIAEAMDTSVPSVKSLLVRARVSLAEAAESRRLTCDEVRLELGAVAEGLQKISPPVRRHIADCERCNAFKKELTLTNRKLAVLAPVGGLLALKNVLALKLFGGSAAAGTGGLAGATGVTGAAGAAGAAGAGASAAAAGAGVSAGLGTIAAKVGAGLATAAIVTGGVAQVAKNDVNTGSLSRGAAITQPADIGAKDLTGGVAPEPPAAAQTDATDDLAAASEQAEEAAPPASEAPPATDPVEVAPKPEPSPEVIDEEHSTAVVEPGTPTDEGATGPTGGTETPGMPTAPEPPATSPTPPTSSPTPPTGPTGSSAPQGATGATGASDGPTPVTP